MKYAYFGAGLTAFLATTLLFLAAISTTTVTTAYAQEEVETTSDEAVDQSTEETDVQLYSITAVECDTNTHLVRRAIISYGRDSGVSISPELLVATETDLVATQNLSDTLHVGDTLSIGGGDISAAIERVEANGGVALWSGAASRIDVNTAVAAVEGAGSVITQLPENIEAVEGSEDDETNPADNGGNGSDDDSNENESEEASTDDDGDEDDTDGGNGYWWLAGGAGVAGLWYLLYRRNES